MPRRALVSKCQNVVGRTCPQSAHGFGPTEVSEAGPPNSTLAPIRALGISRFQLPCLGEFVTTQRPWRHGKAPGRRHGKAPGRHDEFMTRFRSSKTTQAEGLSSPKGDVGELFCHVSCITTAMAVPVGLISGGVWLLMLLAQGAVLGHGFARQKTVLGGPVGQKVDRGVSLGV
jgi:hypothetical protein